MPITNDDYNTIQLSPEYTPRITILAVTSSIILFITVIITIAIINPLLNQPSIAPISSSRDPHLSQINLSDLDYVLFTHVNSFYDLSLEQIQNFKSVIREDTIKYKLDENDKITSATFIIDVNDPKLTYQVNDQIDADFISLNCPTIDLVQDPNVFCIGYDRNSTIDANLGKYLPYQGTTPNGTVFSIWRDFNDDGRPYIDSYANICNDESISNEVKTSIKYWLMQHGIPNPDVIPLNFHSDYCFHGE